MELSTTELRHISHQVQRGNALWGVLLANEYLDANSRLKRLIVDQARKRCLLDDQISKELRERVLAGSRACELPPHWRSYLGTRIIPEKRYVPTNFPTRKEAGVRRLAARYARNRPTKRNFLTLSGNVGVKNDKPLIRFCKADESR